MSSTCKKRRFVSHGGDIWGFSRKYNIPLEEVLEFSGPINFLGPSPKAVEAVKQNAKLIRYYPDPNPVEFKEEIAKYVGHGVEEENIAFGQRLNRTHLYDYGDSAQRLQSVNSCAVVFGV